MDQLTYRRHRFPSIVIQQAVWLYFRFALSYRDIEDMLAERGIDVSYETVRRWALKFGTIIARKLRRGRPRPDGRWHLDEVFVSINGRQLYVWRALECVHIELDDDEAQPSQYRERLISRETRGDIIPDDFAFAVVEVMPEWVKEVIRNAFPRRSEDYTDLQRQLQELLNKYKVKVPGRRIDPAGQPSNEDAGELAGSGTGEPGGVITDTPPRTRTPRRRLHEAPEGATTTALYEVYEKAPEIIMLTTLEDVEDKKLRSKAAEFISLTGVLFVNGLYEAVDRTVADLEREFVGQADPEALRDIIVTAARNAMAYRVGKATVFALAKRANEDWTETDLSAALSKESLSIAGDNYEENLNSVRRAIREGIKMQKAAA